MKDYIYEKDYVETMETTVMPYINSRRKDGYVKAADGKKLHYAHYSADNKKGIMIICHGFTESCEKFHEFAYYFLINGFSVYIPEHRGHGLSYRAVADEKITHIDRFEEYVDDFELFIKKTVIAENPDTPLYLFAHSMGGAIGTLVMKKNPTLFKKAILSAPMILPKTAQMPPFVAKTVANICGFFSGFNKKPFIFKDDPEFKEDYSLCCVSKVRFDNYYNLKLKHKHLQNRFPTYSWIKQSLRVEKMILDDGEISKVETPVKLFVAGNDVMVERAPQEKLAESLKYCETEVLTNAKHETFSSDDETLEKFLDHIFEFLNR